jgi:hypothetical protein
MEVSEKVRLPQIDRSHSDVVDAATAAMTLSSHHDWVRHVADKVVIGGDELWRAMCKSYIEISKEDAFSQIVEAVHEEFNVT